jgi:hypothetical protein
VVVVHGAAEAAAIALVETPVVAPPAPASDHEVDGALPVGRDTAVGHDTARSYAPGPVELAPAPAVDAPAVEPTTAPTASPAEAATPSLPATSDAVTSDRWSDTAPSAAEPDREPGEAPDPDRTDELPALRLRAPISDADAEHDEMMRTTAQLSALLGDREPSGDEPSGDTP